VIDPNALDALGAPLAKAVAKRGDFEGLSPNGTVQGLLFPASPAFSPDGKTLYVSNLSLYLPYAGVPEPAVDSPWTLEVEHYTIAAIRGEIPPFREPGAGAHRPRYEPGK